MTEYFANLMTLMIVLGEQAASLVAARREAWAAALQRDFTVLRAGLESGSAELSILTDAVESAQKADLDGGVVDQRALVSFVNIICVFVLPRFWFSFLKYFFFAGADTRTARRYRRAQRRDAAASRAVWRGGDSSGRRARCDVPLSPRPVRRTH